jgi:hypothetical protein
MIETIEADPEKQNPVAWFSSFHDDDISNTDSNSHENTYQERENRTSRGALAPRP